MNPKGTFVVDVRVNQVLLHRHAEINASMRAILVEWLWEVCHALRIRVKTFFAAIHILDANFVCGPAVRRKDLQLFGVTALLLSCKLEEVHPPMASDFVYICDNTYTHDEVLRAEVIIVKALAWRFPHTDYDMMNKNMEHAAVLMAINGCLFLPGVRHQKRRLCRFAARVRDGSAWRVHPSMRTRHECPKMPTCTVDLKAITQFYRGSATLDSRADQKST